jgi:hypothetical protein
MANDPLIAIPLSHVVEVPGEKHPGLDAPMPAPTNEQMRAADEVFLHSQESDKVLGLIGMWTGVLMLHDLAVEAFETPEDEEEDPRKTRPEDEPPM